MTNAPFDFYSHFSKARNQKQKQFQLLAQLTKHSTPALTTPLVPSLLAKTVGIYLTSVLTKTKSSKVRIKKKLTRSGLKFASGESSRLAKHQIIATAAKSLKWSKATSALYTFFFWAFFFNATRVIFKKRRTALSSYLHSLSKIPYQLPKPIRATFKKTYKSIRKNTNAVFSQPVLSILNVKSSLPKKNPNPLISTKVCALLLTYFFSSALTTDNSPAWKRTLSKRNPRVTASVGASRAVFGLNQYILNLMQQQ